MRHVLAVILSASSLAAQADQPGRFSLDFTNDLLFQRDLNAVEQITGRPKANQYQESASVFGNYALEGDHGSLSGGLTVRYTNVYLAQASITLEHPDAALYTKYLRFTRGTFMAQVGDFNTMLGRGLVLSVIQNSAILKDWTATGADVRGRVGDLDYHVLDGIVTNEMRHLDHGNGANNWFERWRVAGAEVAYEFLKDNRVGYRVSRIDDYDLARAGGSPMGNPFSKGRRLTQSGSLGGDNLFGCFNYYVEAGRMKFQDAEDTYTPSRINLQDGKALYADLAFHRGRWYVMGEFKRYQHFDNELNNPPLADRDTELVNKDDSLGRRLYVQYSFPAPDLTLFASAGTCVEGRLFTTRRMEGSNVYGGFKLQDWLDHITTSFTYGYKTVHTYPALARFPEKRSDGEFTYSFTPTWSLGVTLRDWRRHEPGQAFWRQSDYQFQFAHSPHWALFFTNQVVSYVNTPENPFNDNHLYSGGFRLNLSKGSFVELSGGKMHGGEVCSGGECVIMPAFKGWKLNTHFRF